MAPSRQSRGDVKLLRDGRPERVPGRRSAGVERRSCSTENVGFDKGRHALVLSERGSGGDGGHGGHIARPRGDLHDYVVIVGVVVDPWNPHGIGEGRIRHGREEGGRSQDENGENDVWWCEVRGRWRDAADAPHGSLGIPRPDSYEALPGPGRHRASRRVSIDGVLAGSIPRDVRNVRVNERENLRERAACRTPRIWTAHGEGRSRICRARDESGGSYRRGHAPSGRPGGGSRWCECGEGELRRRWRCCSGPCRSSPVSP